MIDRNDARRFPQPFAERGPGGIAAPAASSTDSPDAMTAALEACRAARLRFVLSPSPATQEAWADSYQAAIAEVRRQTGADLEEAA